MEKTLNIRLTQEQFEYLTKKAYASGPISCSALVRRIINKSMKEDGYGKTDGEVQSETGSVSAED